jgi:hypothetical protein
VEFSDESRLLVEHWEAYKDVIEAYEALEERELPAILDEVIEEIEEASWLGDWHIKRVNSEKFYLMRNEWIVEGDEVLKIGVAKFDPDHVFDTERSHPELRVRMSNSYPDLPDRLLAELEERNAIIGVVDTRSRVRDWISDSVQKCPPDSLDGYAEAAKTQMIEFLRHYAEVLPELDPIIREEIARAR